MTTLRNGKGGAGGNAEVTGNDSQATGGDGGEGVIGDGGAGGSASVRGNRSTGIGGKGGRGGLGPGQPGGDATVNTGDTFYAGGQGGESVQPDGRGGRGGRAYEIALRFGFERRHMRLPYGEPNKEFGRGGDGADTPQYMARRLIIEEIKRDFFARNSIPQEREHQIWYDREVVAIEYLNDELERLGHRWRVAIVADEYEFADMVKSV